MEGRVFDADLMFLTGAGASMPVRIPGMAGMVREFKIQHGLRHPARKAYESLQEIGVPDDLEDVLQFCNRLIELREHQVGKVIHQSVAPRASGKKLADFKKNFSKRIDDAENLRSELIRWIGGVCLRFDRTKANDIFGDLVPLLAQSEIPVFTTNYDGVLDEVAENQGIEVADNFLRDARGRKFWDATHRSFTGPGLRLVKMHGSIYWHATRGDTVIEKLRQPAPENAEGEPLTQLLIFPTRFKDIYQQNYFPLYSAFTRTLGRASTLVLIGHSLRDEYLLAAIRERLKDPSFALVVVDVRLPAAVKRLPGRVLHMNGGVERFAPLLCRGVQQHGSSGAGFHAYMEEAMDAVRRGRKEKVEYIAGVPQWVDPGEQIVVNLKLQTLVSAYHWGASIYVNRKWSPLYRSRENAEEVKGFGTKEEVIRFRIPSDLVHGESYKLSFSLWDRSGSQVARAERKIRVRQGK
jgi:hypothetical protein